MAPATAWRLRWLPPLWWWLPVVLGAALDERRLVRRRSEGAQASLPTDLTSITSRFATIDSRLETLKTQFVTLQNVVLKVQSQATVTNTTLVQSEALLSGARSLAKQNQVNAGVLAAQFDVTSATIGNATEEMLALKAHFAPVEEATLMLAIAASDVGKKVGDLEMAVHDLLPGKDFLPTRIQRAQQHLQSYTGSVASGALDPVVAGTIRGNFLRAQARTESLADEVLHKKALEEETTSGVQPTHGAATTSS